MYVRVLSEEAKDLFAVMLSGSDDELREVKSDERYIKRPERYFDSDIR